MNSVCLCVYDCVWKKIFFPQHIIGKQKRKILKLIIIWIWIRKKKTGQNERERKKKLNWFPQMAIIKSSWTEYINFTFSFFCMVMVCFITKPMLIVMMIRMSSEFKRYEHLQHFTQIPFNLYGCWFWSKL